MSRHDSLKKVSIIVSKGSFEGVYPGLIMAHGARMEGMEANLFFTFFGLHAIVKKKMNKLKVATVGNPALCVPTPMGMPMPTGIRFLKAHAEAIIPWAWAANGYFTVVGSALSVLLAVNLGFSVVFIGSALIYAVAPFFLTATPGRPE